MSSTKLRNRTIALNMLAEFLASALYSLLYFIFISRYLSEEINLGYTSLSFAIGLSFFAAIYIPFHTYRIHVIPFLTIVNAMRKKQWRILWHKIPAQIGGAFLGVMLFHSLNSMTTNVRIDGIYEFNITDPYLSAFFNAVITSILCYFFFMMRLFFKGSRLTATILLSLFVAFLFFMSGKVGGLSALNPFGRLFYDLLEEQTFLSVPWYDILIVHVMAPVAAAMLIFYRMKGFLTAPYERRHKVEEPAMRNYDI